MNPWVGLLTVVGAATALATVWLVWKRWQRLRYYQSLAARRAEIVARHRPALCTPVNTADLTRQFAAEHLVRATGILTPELLEQIRGEATANLPRVERSYLPTHKKGGALSYENIHLHAPHSLAVYHSEALQRWVSAVVGEPVRPTADHDQSSCSLLYYNEPGDHIHWHFDHNFYRGRHFTVLISVVNRAAAGGLSQGRFQKKVGSDVLTVDTQENAIVIFEGKKVLHRASPVGPDETRIILSMTFCTNPAIGWGWELVRRVKDTAFFGPRVLWQ